MSNEIYANVEFDNDNVEDLYTNYEIINSHDSRSKTKDVSTKSRPLATNLGTESSERRSTRDAAVCLGLLCVLLLSGIIGLFVYYNGVMGSSEENILVYKTNSSAEQNQLQTKYKTMTKDRDQLQVERDNLQAKLSVVEQDTQQGWRYYKSSFYLTSTEKKTWEGSREDCLSRGADLVVINSREEYVFIHGLNKETFWIGLTDRVEEGIWKWVDSTALTTGYWGKEQPNNQNGMEEDCAARWSDLSTTDNGWHDAPCNELHFWICEKTAFL
ncbi:CD209 antigen-like protein E [Salvelinus fontinalis]|uniref:CD209 antigen-like protein E n=1 Tax=Salvelinus fontinalis TaxID=8038 RepID=UPI002486850C|nr:CD209 antigen-like protein E [Salvelinus fontinalis]